jgi:hypothetical protein
MIGSWHDDLENAVTVDEAVASVQRYLGALPVDELEGFARHCRPSRIKGDGDVDDLTAKLAQAQRHPSYAEPLPMILGEVFDFVLHASLRISQLNRARVGGMVNYGWRRQMSSQMMS